MDDKEFAKNRISNILAYFFDRDKEHLEDREFQIAFDSARKLSNIISRW